MKTLYNENGTIAGYYIPEDEIDENHRKVMDQWFNLNMFQNEHEKSNNSFANKKLNGNKDYIIKDYVIEIN